jgi:hypothetical protein
MTEDPPRINRTKNQQVNGAVGACPIDMGPVRPYRLFLSFWLALLLRSSA